MPPSSPQMPGETLGRYRIEAFIGEGGMGRVYRALDPTLGRPVAIKILPPGLVHDEDRLERFVREARTASSLNHPNVVTIYEIGSSEQVHYIAMELLDGETLRDRLAHGTIDLRRTIDIMAQVADGIAAAHSAGVIHRDLKPENIILTKSGFAKILDFGLAKLREASHPSDEAATAKRTDPGTVLGSVGYMSPEQASGREADHRSDIFSLGCILYEAITGRRAFGGQSSVDTLHRIIHDDPTPLREQLPDSSSELQRIVRKCLAKDPDERYQSAKDLSIDLRSLKREIESQPRGRVATMAPKSRGGLWIAAAIVALLIVAAIVLPLRRRAATAEKAALPLSVTRITASGNVIGATISPDGEYVAYAYSDAGKHSLWVRQIATGSALQLVPPSAIGVWGLTFSPDSRSIDYAAKSGTDPSGGLYQIPILGGSPRKLLIKIDSSVTFSPDGKRIAFLRANEPKPGESAIVIANADGTGEKILISRAPPQVLAPVFWGGPAWSPDGKLIATGLHTDRDFSVLAVPVDGGATRVLSSGSWGLIGQLVWLRDMSGLIVVGGGAGTLDSQLWLISYPDGQRKQITNDLFDYRMVSLGAGDKSLVTVAADATSAVWLTPLSEGARPTKLSDGKYDGFRGIAAASDGVVFASLESGEWDLWWVDRRGTGRRQLTPVESQGMAPAISPDGRFVVFATPRQRDWALARINRDGSDLKILCGFVQGGSPAGTPVITPDGRSVVFVAAPGGLPQLWKVSIDGGTPARLLADEAGRPSVSPDGKWVAFERAGKISLVPMTGDGPRRTIAGVSQTTYSMVRWTADSKALLHNSGLNDRKNIWLQPLDGSPARQVTHFDDQYVLYFDVVPGGRELAVVRGILSRDAVLIRNFR